MRVASMADNRDEALITFAARWEPYGGADASEIFVCFGLSESQYRARLYQALTRSGHGAVDVDARVRTRLLRYSTS
ncbi:hypothetical protein CH272_00300 [Rhodococcus sp. 05-340-1]|jgi:hypothetical protein|nr:hypothetical protein CH271_13235 [Rhodococcus sp. 05-340-2]OZD84880.1 hypothetical protein CH272_00300 [Rhodococcus sp. 05-340-1]OZE96311.1 hypothetical protein CH302_15645 [Rhodococcus sp. 15-2388-1-1a]OZF30639.1 hypothetical protein CH295_16290 [Rhodococcus sp. 14-2483-1-2]